MQHPKFPEDADPFLEDAASHPRGRRIPSRRIQDPHFPEQSSQRFPQTLRVVDAVVRQRLCPCPGGHSEDKAGGGAFRGETERFVQNAEPPGGESRALQPRGGRVTLGGATSGSVTPGSVTSVGVTPGGATSGGATPGGVSVA